MDIKNNKRLIKNKNIYIYFYIFFTLFLNINNFFIGAPRAIILIYDFISLAGKLYLIFWGVFLLFYDHKINNELSVINTPAFKYSGIFMIYLLLLTVFHQTTFSSFNNAYYIIHSFLFFYVMLIYGNKYRWIRSVSKIAICFVTIVSSLSVISFLIYLISFLGLADTLQNTALKAFIFKVAPRGKPLNGIINDSSSLASLLLYSTFIYFFLILYFKRTRLTYLFASLVLINCINIFLTKSFSSILSLVIWVLIFSILYFIILIKYDVQNEVKSKGGLIVFFSLLLILILYILISNTIIASEIKLFFIDLFELNWINENNPREAVWNTILGFDKKYYILGISQDNLAQLFINNNIENANSILSNNGRYFNIFITLLVNYGIFALIGFVGLLIFSMVVVFKDYFSASYRRKRFVLFFLFQVFAILLSSYFVDFALMQENIHSLLFMFSYAILIGLTYSDEKDFVARDYGSSFN